MIKLYHPKSRAVREVRKGDELVLRCLKRAGFLIGKLPDLPGAKAPATLKPLPPTEKDAEGVGAKKEPVLAEHTPVEDLLKGKAEEGEAEENPFSGMNMKELRAAAKEHEVVVPWTVRSKKAIAAFLAEELSKEEEGEAEETTEEGEGDEASE